MGECGIPYPSYYLALCLNQSLFLDQVFIEKPLSTGSVTFILVFRENINTLNIVIDNAPIFGSPAVKSRRNFYLVICCMCKNVGFLQNVSCAATSCQILRLPVAESSRYPCHKRSRSSSACPFLISTKKLSPCCPLHTMAHRRVLQKHFLG